jgi:hypothetical protein
MGQVSAVQATIKGGVSDHVAIGNSIFQLVNINEGIINIVLPPDEPVNWGQLS